jgi:hypothetical protein
MTSAGNDQEFLRLGRKLVRFLVRAKNSEAGIGRAKEP